ncbi:MAG: hypothetical protein ABI288_06825 [Ginsengibacter sp.]
MSHFIDISFITIIYLRRSGLGVERKPLSILNGIKSFSTPPTRVETTGDAKNINMDK